MSVEPRRILVVTSGIADKKSFLAEAFRDAGADVVAGKLREERRVDRLLQPLGLGRMVANRNALESAVLTAHRAQPYDLVCIVKGLSVRRNLIEAVKAISPACKVVCWTCDDQFLSHNQSRAFVEAAPVYDLIFTCKSNNVRNDELRQLGFRRVELLHQAYSEHDHRPTPVAGSVHTGKVIFIGYAENKRFEYINHLARNGIPVEVYGSGWHKAHYRRRKHADVTLHLKPLVGRDYAEAISNAAISLCFLRELNRDLHTSRTFEIPACGGFMLAERTEEHLLFFREGEEADFFSSRDELLDKARAYLADPVKRAAVARQGYERTRVSKYAYSDMVERMLRMIDDAASAVTVARASIDG